jgi:glycosyltransferase involved in cell wall biosynthesis
MKVAMLVSQYPAPSHTFIRREVAALRDLGVDIETFSIRPGECLSDEDRSERARTFTVLPGSPAALAWPLLAALLRHPGRWFQALRASARHSLPGIGQRFRSLVYFAEGLRLAIELERRGIGHVHNHFANPAAVAGLVASRYLGIGWSVTLHGLSDFAGPSTPLLRVKVEDAAFVVTATEWGRERLLATLGPRCATKLHVVRCGVQPERMPAPARSHPAPGEPLEILCVGRLAPEKGHLGLVEAVSDLLRRGVEFRLTLIGGGPEEGAIRAAVAARGLANRVELRGPQSELAVLQAMARAHVFAMSSLMEGLPVVLMEALAMELPVVAPDITGIPELVREGETGLLYPAGDWKQLAARLERLATDPEIRVRLGRAGKERVLRDFDVRNAAVPLARLLDAETRRAPPITSR